MTDPTKIRKDVLNFLEAFSGLRVEEIQDSDRLKIELRLDHVAHVFLAMSLRGYIRSMAPGQTLKTNKIEKNGFTVLGLINLVIERVGQ